MYTCMEILHSTYSISVYDLIFFSHEVIKNNLNYKQKKIIWKLFLMLISLNFI